MKNSNGAGEASQANPSFWKRFVFIFITLVIALLAGGIVVERYQGEQKLQKLVLRAESLQREDIRLFTLPFAWSVRKELMRGNYSQIDDYFNELIKRKEFGLVMLVDPAGIIKVSTDRKLLGGSFSRLYPSFNFGSMEPLSYGVAEHQSLFLVPVMGLNEKIGTIAFLYRYREFSLP
jgi:hypothetical protein